MIIPLQNLANHMILKLLHCRIKEILIVKLDKNLKIELIKIRLLHILIKDNLNTLKVHQDILIGKIWLWWDNMKLLNLKYVNYKLKINNCKHSWIKWITKNHMSKNNLNKNLHFNKIHYYNFKNRKIIRLSWCK